MKKKMKYLNIDYFLVLVFEIQVADINSNTMKTTNRKEGDVNRRFFVQTIAQFYIESWHLGSISLSHHEKAWLYNAFSASKLLGNSIFNSSKYTVN